MNCYTAIDEDLLIELKSRAKIGLFMVLTWQLALVIYPPIKNTALMLVLATLVDLVSISVISKFANMRNIGHDINEFNVYSVLAHLVEIPVYYLTSISSDYHNYTIWGLYILAICRLAYFGKKLPDGDYQGLPVWGILGYCRKRLTIKHKTPNKYLPDVLFFGAALPLWYIIYKTNDQAVTITTVGLMLFIYFISDAIKVRAESPANVAPATDSEALLQEFNQLPPAEKEQFLKQASTGFAAADKAIVRAAKLDSMKYNLYRFAALFFGIIMLLTIFTNTISIPGTQSNYYRHGYKQGYLDAKEGKKQLTAAERERKVDCHRHDEATQPMGPIDPYCRE